MLCEFAHNFPDQLADFLERDNGLKRNFREETATELLMAGMVGLQQFGVSVELPDEAVTGADMDWIYAAPHDVGGGTYLRLMIQAKRAKFAKLKHGGYWYYQHLDHGTPPGHQAQTLVAHAATAPNGMATLPLYFFYHPRSAIVSAPLTQPNVKGINVVFADRVVPIVDGGCPRHEKRVGAWHEHFFSMSELLCWPFALPAPPSPPSGDRTEFLIDGVFTAAGVAEPLWHPDFVADRLNTLRQLEADTGAKAPELVEATADISDEFRRAVYKESTAEDRQRLKRPRVILRTSMTRGSPNYATNREALRSRRT